MLMGLKESLPGTIFSENLHVKHQLVLAANTLNPLLF